jgi:uncharacterized protein (TIGR04255 family)
MPPTQSSFLKKLANDYQRVVYKNNTLVEVIFQLRFPQLLVIDDRTPANFQSQVSKDFPFLEISTTLPLFVAATELKPAPTKTYTFFSLDKHKKISLTSNFISISTDKYTRWDDFLPHVRRVVSSFRKCFPEQQNISTRTGLRYRDVIDRAKIGMGEVRWDDLISPQLFGILRSGVLPAEMVGSAHSLYTLKVDGLTMLFQHGVLTNTDGLSSYFLDYDIYVDKEEELPTNKIADRANHLHKWIGPLFRWCITDKLHAALKPTRP